MTVAAQATLADGRKAEWHDDLGTVGRYRIVNADGTVVPGSERDYDTFEQGQKAERAARASFTTNDSANRQRLRDDAANLNTQIENISALAGSTTGNTRVLAVGLLLALRLIRRMGRLLTGDLTTAD